MRGRYTGHLKSETLKALYEKELEADDIKDLTDEIALARAFTAACLEKLGTVELADLEARQIATVQVFVKDVGNLVEQMARVEQRLEATLSAADLYAVTSQILEAVRRHVKDPAVLEALANEVEGLIVLRPGQRPEDGGDGSAESGAVPSGPDDVFEDTPEIQPVDRASEGDASGGEGP